MKSNMDIQEIERYIRVGSGFVEISRDYLAEYNGICRRVYIRENKMQIDYISSDWLEYEEGEETFYFCYDNFESVIKSAERYLKKSVSEWINYNRTYNLWNFPECDENAWRDLFSDLQKHKLYFPSGFSEFTICTIYARGIFQNMISPDDDAFELFENDELIYKIQENKSEFKIY